MTNFLRYAFPTLLFIVSAYPLSAASPTTEPIELSADQGEVDYNKKVSRYQGNVILKQADMEIRGEDLNLFFAKDNALLTISIEGDPASFEQKAASSSLSAQESTLKAHANRLDYELQPTRKLVLSGKAVLWQGLNRFDGERIEYNFDTDIVRAHSGDSPSSRVNVTIYQEPDSQPHSGEGSAP